jgi:penicillin amidase
VSLSRLLFRLLLGRRLPRTEGELTVPGLRGEVLIRRDRWGIPHIDAHNEHDAHFAVGFCHGQDRTFQLEVLLRVQRGMLAERFGAPALPVDRLSRRIGFHRAALRQLEVLDDDVRSALEAYAAGAQAGARLGLPRRPHEFALVGGRPTPWTAADSLGVIKLTSFTLASNWDAELARWRVLLDDGPQAVADLDPAYPPDLPVVSPPGAGAGASLDRLREELAAFAAFAPPGGGSNNWALSATRTATGRPLLANDPHLDAGLPCHWYLAHVRCPEWQVAGASFIGGPSVLIGHNGFAAWGLTAGLVDNTDLFREQLSPDGLRYRQGAEYLPCEVRDEEIDVKGAGPVVERVRTTPRGPIISPLTEDDGEALALRAVWLDPLPLRGMLGVQRARSFAAFRAEFAQWPAVAFNMAYADAGGAIGWQLAGQAPRRRSGAGLLPQPGWDPEAGWEDDLVPFEQMPHLQDPPNGFVATANTQPTADGEGPYLGADWIDGYRLALIGKALAARSDWDVAAALRLQTDQESLPWQEMKAVVLAAPADDPDAAEGLRLLRAWDGRVTADSPAAAVYELFVADMVRAVAEARAPRSAIFALGAALSALSRFNFFCFRRTGHLSRLLRRQPAGWFGHGWPEQVARALAAVVRRLRERHGDDPQRWQWGRLRTLTMHHPIGKVSRLLAPIFNLGPVPCGGDSETINQASVLPNAPLAPADNIASLRVAIDVGNWGASRYVLPGGQSGNPLSPHYRDLFALWRRGEGVPIAWTDDEVRRATRRTLRLSPA